jgi:hypothetical protein
VLPALVALGGRAYLEPARFSSGFHTAMLICAGSCAVGGLIAAVTISGRRAAGGTAAGATGTAAAG